MATLHSPFITMRLASSRLYKLPMCKLTMGFRNNRLLNHVDNLMTMRVQRMLCNIPSLEGMPPPFPYKDAKYNSSIINAGKARAEDTSDFAAKLFATVTHLRHEKKNAMWLKVPLDFAHYIPLASTFGFKLHHATTEYIMMVVWLRNDVSCKIPAFATHHVGVAGVVMDGKENILVIKERYPNATWKFPGGLAELGEDLGVAASREVKEETGIETEFQSVLAFRQQHKMQFGNSDLYFVCRMKQLKDSDIPLKPCAHEVSDIRWMPIDEFEAQNQSSMLATMIKIFKNKDSNIEMKADLHESIVPARPPFLVYHSSN